ncbi:MAG: DMT family transporter [Bacilli bacterium]|nr:DMT family transporter [Bacilli bacterium]
MNKKTLISEALLLVVTSIWGMAFIFQDIAMKYLEPFSFNVVRSFVGSLFLLIVALIVAAFRKHKGIAKPNRGKDLIIGSVLIGIATGIAMAMQQIGIKLEGAGKSGFITSLYIIFVPILGIFLKKKCPPVVIIAVMLALTGVYLINVSDGDWGFSFSEGTWYLLGCSFTYAIQILLIDHYSPKCDSIELTCGEFFIAGLLEIPFMFIFESPTISGFTSCIWPILFCGIASTGIAYTLQVYCQKNVPVTIASLLMSTESTFSVLFSLIFLHSVYEWQQLVGCFVVLVAVILSQIPTKKLSQIIET